MIGRFNRKCMAGTFVLLPAILLLGCTPPVNSTRVLNTTQPKVSAETDNRNACRLATRYINDHWEWDTFSFFANNLTEAKRRGLTLEQCGSLLGYNRLETDKIASLNDQKKAVVATDRARLAAADDGRKAREADVRRKAKEAERARVAAVEAQRLAREADASVKAKEAERARSDDLDRRNRATQEKLEFLGFYTGVIDGVLGPASKLAISAWQAARGQLATGQLSDTQYANLQAEKVQIAAKATAPVLSPTPAINRHAVAVILGNRDYGEPVPDVDYAANDADAMRRFVIERLGYRDGNIIDLRDASQAEMTSVFGRENDHQGKLWRLVRTGKSDVTVFYSGHGVPGLRDNKGYLLPVDADPDTVELNGYPLDWLLNNLAKIKARSMTVYLDACFSGESPKGMLIQAVSGLSIEPRMPSTNSDMTVITAATGDQVASWDKKAKHGLFTKHLLDALAGAADKGDYGDGDGKVTVGEVKRYLDDEMTYAAQRNNGRVQTATIKGDTDTVLAVIH
jgi:peptidoglycan hydrolase-like protein with peptidoglycan-binding domain